MARVPGQHWFKAWLAAAAFAAAGVAVAEADAPGRITTRPTRPTT
jgi:hypothetical protein